MMKWDMVRADEYCDSVRDGTHDTPKPTKTGYKLVTGKHIKNGQIDSTDAYYISEKDYKTINQRSLVEQWDVIMSMIGTVGEVAVVKNIPDYAIKNVALFKIGGSKLKGKWLAYYLHSPEAKGHMFGNMKGSSQQFLSLKQLRGLPVPIAPEQYMKKAIAILSAYDDLIENNQKQIKLLEEAAQRLYKEWFMDLRFPGHEDVAIADGVPEGWHIGTIDEIVEYHDKIRKPLSSIQRSSFKGEYRYYGAAGVLDYVEKYLFDGTYLLLGEDGSVITNDGTPVLQYITGKFWVNNHAHVLTGKSPFTTEFIYMLFCKMGVSDIVTGVAQPKISQARLSSKKVLIPSEKAVIEYQSIVAAIFERILLLEKLINIAEQARDRLLPKLMSGELEV